MDDVVQWGRNSVSAEFQVAVLPVAAGGGHNGLGRLGRRSILGAGFPRGRPELIRMEPLDGNGAQERSQ